MPFWLERYTLLTPPLQKWAMAMENGEDNKEELIAKKITSKAIE